MRIVSFSFGGRPSTGVLVDDDCVLSVESIRSDFEGVGSVELASDPERLAFVDEFVRDSKSGGIRHSLNAVRLLASIPRPGKIFALAANYPAHAVEVGERVRSNAGEIPHVFPKLPSSLVGPGDPIVIPSISDMVDYEVELAVVIGRVTSDVTEGAALDHVAGYAVFNDVSARQVTFPRRPKAADDDGFWDFLYGKWCDGFSIVGPWLVTTDEIPDPGALEMELMVNSVVRQRAVTGDMIFEIEETIAFLSSICTLEPGDMIAMGTPAGIGEMGSGLLKHGDVVEATIEGLGTLKNAVTDPAVADLPSG